MSYYLTTPIYYVNSTPHLGHAYTTIAADVVARFHRLLGERTFFLTGTDEHGAKIATAAEEAGVTPQQLADTNSQRFRDLLPLLDAQPDFFIRTTDPRHKQFVQGIWQKLREGDDIYEATYSGPYCAPCEAYYSEDELVDGNCPIHKLPVSVLDETNYFFRLSKYQQQLLDHFDANPDWIQPRSRFNEARAFIAGGLQDISVSRSSITWGVPVPWDADQVSYVWIDALFNYMSALGFGAETDVTDEFWPPALQLLGKDILRFHAAYWPAFLLACGFELPHKLFIHGYLTMGGEKMSKTAGNVFDPFPIIESHGADPVRFYVLREVQFGQDGSVSHEGFESRYTSELANDLGNLVSRSANMVGRYVDAGTVPEAPADSPIAQLARETRATWLQQMGDLQLTAALETVWQLVRALNKHVEDRAPWKLAKAEDDASQQLLRDTLAELVEGLAQVGLMLHPVMPGTSDKLLRALGIDPAEINEWAAVGAERTWGVAAGRTVTQPEPMFPRLDPVASS